MNSRTRISPPREARFVAELGLQVIDKLGKLAIGADLPTRQVSHHLFVGHSQRHVSPGAVLPVYQLRVGRVPAAGLLPQVARLRDRHGDLLPTDRVHLLANDGLDLVQAAARQRQIGIDARAQRLDKAGARQQLVAGQLCIGWRVAAEFWKKALDCRMNGSPLERYCFAGDSHFDERPPDRSATVEVTVTFQVVASSARNAASTAQMQSATTLVKFD